MLADLLTRAAAAERRLAVLLAPHALGVGEWRVLVRLHDAGPAAPSALADALVLTRGGVTRIVDRLIARRLAVRAAAGRADARYQTLALTGAGVAVVRTVAPLVAELERSLSPAAVPPPRRD